MTRPPQRLPPPAHDPLHAELLAGLSAPRKSLPAKWFYDSTGSALFERICTLPEYYLTRTEAAIFDAHLADMAQRIGSRALVIEPGSGTGEKAERLLAALHEPVAFVPVEVAAEYLQASVTRLRARFPGLEVLPVVGDFTQALRLPRPQRAPRRTLVFFPGSTIGNLSPAAAERLLAGFARHADRVLVGVDLRKDAALLLPAYDDAAGVTAAFNLNMLARLNRELGADFDLSRFRHRVRWDEDAGRIEMHLESQADQLVTVAGRRIAFRRGETIHTEDSHKYRPEDFAALAGRAGWRVDRLWRDAQGWFSVQLLAR